MELFIIIIIAGIEVVFEYFMEMVGLEIFMVTLYEYLNNLKNIIQQTNTSKNKIIYINNLII